MNQEIITTARLELKKVDQALYDFVFEHCTEEEQMKYLGLSSIEQLKQTKIDHAKGLSSYKNSFVVFYMYLKETDTMIGWCGFHVWYLKHRRAEIGYELFKDDYKNKGYMTEAMKAVLRYGFSEMELHRVEAFVGHHNIPSLRLMDIFGFEKEGCLKEHYLKDGTHEDSLVFGLLNKKK